jgi:hypothetical protein
MHPKSRLTRRQFLAGMVAALGGLTLAGLRPQLTKADENIDHPVCLPLMFNKSYPGMPAGRVVHVHSASATHWNGENAWWEHADATIIENMLNQGLTSLTGTTTVADAWRAILPAYQAGQKIAIKVNFNNSWICDEADRQIDGLAEPVNAVVKGLEQIGVARPDICIYDAIRALPARFVSRCLSGISFFDGSYRGVCRNPAGFRRTPETRLNFQPPPGVVAPTAYVTDVLMNAAYLINMPIMKGGHPIAGVTLGAKNHFGTIDNPSGVHTLVDVVHGSSRDDYNPLVDFLRSPLIGGKTVLTIGDGLFAARVFDQAPATWVTFGSQLPNSLFLSKDKVAIDCVMYDLIAAELGNGLPGDANNYLRLAGEAGLGIFEQGDPWQTPYGSGYRSIQYIRVEV